MTRELRLEARVVRGLVQARLSAKRDDGWHLCGVFQLRREEWEALAPVMVEADIDVAVVVSCAESTKGA